MLTINNLSFHFGSRTIYEQASLHIKPKDRIGLIGANGTGKSTLLRLIYGEYTPDSGDISRSRDCTIGFLNQDLLSYLSDKSILEVALEAFEEQNTLQNQINEIIKQLESEYSEDLVNKLTSLQERFETLGGYTIQSQAEEILEGLGFDTEGLQRPLKEYSGGWRMRVMLAKLLLQKPSLLMLDEPTNHLDLPSIQWIESYVQNYEGAIITVSHDRNFIRNVSNVIVEVIANQLDVYGGDYDFYLKERELRREIQKAAFKNQQQKIKQTERFIERFRAKASKAKQVQSRVKSLERLDRIDDVLEENIAVDFKFNFGQKSGKQVAQLMEISKNYGDLQILKDTGAGIMRGDKIALIGANGKGKSTLLRILAGTESFNGQREFGHNVKYSFFAQHQLESLNIDNEIIDELKQAGSGKTETELRNILGCFLFTDEDVFKKIKVLSGGEKSRVALAKVLISEANFLLLDEPTNHLDMQSVNILIQALRQYEGTFVAVSHDRYFISEIANKIWYIENQEIKEYPGTYLEFADWYSKRMAKLQVSPTKNSNGSPKKSNRKKNQSANNPEIQQLQKDLKALQKSLQVEEDAIEKLEGQIESLERELAKPEVYQNEGKLRETQEQYEQAKKELDTAQNKWEEMAMEIDELEEKLKS